MALSSREKPLFQKKFLDDNTTSQNIGGRMHGPSLHLKFWEDRPLCPHKSPPMFSSMQRLRTWERSTMAESRFNGLALMNIHSNNDVGHIDQFKVLKILTKYFIH